MSSIPRVFGFGRGAESDLDQSPEGRADYLRGYDVGIDAVAASLTVAVDAGGKESEVWDAAAIIFANLVAFLDEKPVGASEAELRGRYCGALYMLSGFAWQGFLSLPPTPLGGLN